jgi:hypothetical protein
MDNNSPLPAVQKLSGDQRRDIYDALLLHFRDGLSVQDAFERVPTMSRQTYYRLRKQQSEEVEQLRLEARRDAREQTVDREHAFATAQVTLSEQIRRSAAEIIQEALPVMRLIALGVHEVQLGFDRNGNPKIGRPYPRDTVQAFQALQQLAFEGVVNEEFLPQKTDVEKGPELVLPSHLDFTNLTLRRADGSSIEVAKKSGVDVLEGDVIE